MGWLTTLLDEEDKNPLKCNPQSALRGGGNIPLDNFDMLFTQKYIKTIKFIILILNTEDVYLALYQFLNQHKNAKTLQI